MLPLSHGVRRATPLHLIVKALHGPLDEQAETLLRLLARSRHRHLLRFKVER